MVCGIQVLFSLKTDKAEKEFVWPYDIVLTGKVKGGFLGNSATVEIIPSITLSCWRNWELGRSGLNVSATHGS